MLALLKTAVCAVGQRSIRPSLTSAFHILSNPRAVLDARAEPAHRLPAHRLPAPHEVPLLSPTVVSILPECGFKVMGKVRRRCKDCFLVRREERWYNICKTHPRHKQMSMVKKPKQTWILTHATQGKKRMW